MSSQARDTTICIGLTIALAVAFVGRGRGGGGGGGGILRGHFERFS